MVTKNNKKFFVRRQAVTSFFVCLILGFLIGINAVQAAVTGDYNKSVNGTLSASEWNNLLHDFISVNGGEIDGNLNVVGALQATSLAGTYTGTLNAANVSAGSFGSNTGGGNFSFPGNVGIGITTPAQKLDVSGNIRLTGSGWNSLEFFDAVNVANGPQVLAQIVGQNVVNHGTGVLSFYTAFNNSLTEKMRLDNNGYLGIGTTNPSYKLDVNGDARVTGTLTAGSFSGPYSGTINAANVSSGTFASNTGGGDFTFPGYIYANGIKANRFNSTPIVGNRDYFSAYDIRTAPDAPTTDTWHRVLVFPSNDPNYEGDLATTMTNNQARMFFRSKESSFDSGWKEIIMANSAGNVGIGTTNPNDILTVSSPSQTLNAENPIIVSQVPGYTRTSGIYNTIDTLSGLGTGILFKTYKQSVGTYNAMKISHDGNVGIGTTAPTTARLVINPSGSYSIDASGGRIGNITSVADTDAASVAYVKGIIGGGSGSTVGYWTANGANIFNSNGGNVGIGTSTPQAKLDVLGNVNISGNLSANSLTGTLNATNVSAGQFAGSTGGGNFSFPGSVGIGTTNPATMLHISKTAASLTEALLTVNNNYGGVWARAIDILTPNQPAGSWSTPLLAGISHSTNNQLAMDFYYDGVGSSNNKIGLGFYNNDALLVVQANGNVGIGTIAPTQKLDVSGNANVSGTLTAGSFSGPYSGTINAANVSSGIFGSNTGNGNYGFNGSLGVGTSNPVTRAHVYGTLTVDPAGQSANYYSEGIRIGNASNSYSLIQFGADTGAASGNQTNQWWIGKDGRDNGFNIYANQGGDVFHILSNGNVGIGTTNPGGKLDISYQGAFNAITPGTTTYGLHFSGQSTSDYANGITWNGGSSGAQAGLYVQGSGVYGTKMYFATTNYYATGAQTRMMIDYNGNVGIGTTTPAYKLDVNGDARVTGTLHAGSLDVAAMTGTVNAANVSAGSFASNTGGGNFNFPGNIDLVNTTHSNQSGIITKNGTRFISDFNYGNNGTVTTNGGNTFVGNSAGNLTMGSTATMAQQASYNTGVGQSTLQSNIAGFSNSALGYFALYSNTTGYNNSAVGVNALYSNTTGSYNSALGFTALYSNTTGNYNSALGYNAGRYIADGSTDNATSRNSLYLGYYTTALASGDTNEIVIGANAVGLGSNTVVLGGDGITKTALKGNVGIGTTTPAYKLDVNGDARVTGTLHAGSLDVAAMTGTTNAANVSAGTFASNTGGGNFSFPGNVGIGTTPFASLTIPSGTAYGGMIGIEAAANGGSRRWWLHSDYSQWGDFSISTETTKQHGSSPELSRFYISPTGNVGIGAIPPAYKLDVNGDARVTGTLYAGAFSGAYSGTINAANVSSGTFGSNTGGGNFSLMGNLGIGTNNPSELLDVNGQAAAYNFVTRQSGNSRYVGIFMATSGYARMYGWDNTGATAIPLILQDGGGSVGIGTTNPGAKLDILGASSAVNFRVASASGQLQFFNWNDNTNYIESINGAGDASQLLKITGRGGQAGTFDFVGNVGINTTNPGAYALNVQGDANISGTLQTQTGSDFAEEFTAAKDLEPGTVVVMAGNAYKTVKPCAKSYDKTVVGIVSNNPSIIAGRLTGKDKVVVAMMGVVKVKVSAINGIISRGDLLTTSGLSGYAMKAVKDVPGTVIGKAMEDLTVQTGEINVLVNLQ